MGMHAQERMMNRRNLLRGSAALGVAAAFALSVANNAATAAGGAGMAGAAAGPAPKPDPPRPLQPPAQGSLPVAFLISKGAVIIDFCGPWEVFENVSILGRRDDPFRLYTVAETMDVVTASGGMKITPDFTFETAPVPKILVIPAQDGASETALAWVRRVSESTDVTMSVCTGAFVLAKTGLLDGKSATTHHDAYADMAMEFPDIHVIRGARFVESGGLATSGGLSSGIDLSLRVVERYFGREAAAKAAYHMEYQGQGWMDPHSNQVYAVRRVSTAAHPLCPICGMDVDPKTAPSSVYRREMYYFCSPAHKVRFDKAPDVFVEALKS
jgi:putative intracellular protease/amidase/YHS domain-containing protein